MSFLTLYPTESDLISRPDGNLDGDIQGKNIAYTYDVSELNLITKKGNAIPLTEVFQSMEFTEDLYNNFVFGNITIVDPSGGNEKFVFSGGEEIHIKLRKNFSSDGISDILVSRDDFVVTKIRRYTDEENSEYSKYTFELATKAFVKSFKKRVFNSFDEGASIYGIVGQLHARHFSVPGAENIGIEYYNLGITKPLVIPGYTAHKSMQFAAKRLSMQSEKAFLFYERFIPSYKNGNKFTHFFVSLDTLKSQTPTKTIVYSPTLEAFRDIDAGSVLRANKLTKDDGFRHYENMLSGLYFSKITQHDITNQTIVEHNYNIFDSDITKMNGFLAVDRLNLMTNFDENDAPASEKIIPFSNNDVASRHSLIEDYSVDMQATRLQTIQVVISGGNNMLGVGDVVNFRCRSKIFNSDNNSRYIEDKVFSGKYLITAAKHYISKVDGYQKRLELSRESLNINLDDIFSFKSDLIQD
jgi:hypothetical protein